MPPSRILPQCLGEVFQSMHAATVPVILKAVDALGNGGWLTLTEIARHWPGAERVAAPLKAADRLLRSPVLERHREALYAGMARWLVREERPLIVVDWSDLKADGSFKLLRAGLAVQGRSLTLWEEVHPEKAAGTVAVETAFLHTLARVLPPGCRPIVLSDAGFRRPWFCAIQSLGWDYVGRVRGTTHLQPIDAAETDPGEWVRCTALHELALASRSREMGRFRLARTGQPLSTRSIVHAAQPKGRHATTHRGQRRRDRASEDAARSAKEPWVLATSLDADAVPAVQVTKHYQRRMTIEQSFRDLKSGALGAGFEHSLTRKGQRLGHLLVLFALVQLAAWLVGLCAEQRGEGGRLEARRTTHRRHHSTVRLGREVLKRSAWWPPVIALRRFLRDFALDCPMPLRTTVSC
jgi:hypothetical protein